MGTPDRSNKAMMTYAHLDTRRNIKNHNKCVHTPANTSFTVDRGGGTEASRLFSYLTQ